MEEIVYKTMMMPYEYANLQYYFLLEYEYTPIVFNYTNVSNNILGGSSCITSVEQCRELFTWSTYCGGCY